MPFEFIKKTMMTGIGMALKTQTEFEEMTKSFIDKSRMSEEEGRKFIDEMLDKYKESKQNMEKQIETAVKKIIEKTDLASNKDLKSLKDEVEKLKEQLKVTASK